MRRHWRVFVCGDCGHRLRFGGSRCTICGARTRLLNRRWVWMGVALLLITGAALLILQPWG